MSLMLRKKCQTKLDQIGLPNFHVELEKGCSYIDMKIVSECGKPLVTVKGIQFTRIQPSKDEIDYAVELFDAFLAKHGSSLVKAVNLKDSISKQKQAIPQSIEFAWYTGEVWIQYKDVFMEYRISTKEGLLPYNAETTKELTYKDIVNYVFDSDRYKDMLKVLKKVENIYTDTKKLDALESDLASCSI